jgi:hypothetical protein
VRLEVAVEGISEPIRLTAPPDEPRGPGAALGLRLDPAAVFIFDPARD